MTTAEKGISETERRNTSHRAFGSPHLPWPIPQRSADDEPIAPRALGVVVVATAWMAVTVFILATVIGSI